MTPKTAKQLATLLSILLDSHRDMSDNEYIYGTHRQGDVSVFDTQRVIDTLNRNANEEIKKLN